MVRFAGTVGSSRRTDIENHTVGHVRPSAVPLAGTPAVLAGRAAGALPRRGDLRGQDGAGRPRAARISQIKVNDLSHSWPGGTEDARAIFGAVGEAGPSYVHVNAHHGFDSVFGSGKSLAALARAAVPKDVAIVACGKLNDPALAESMLADGTADVAAIAKGALADPAWPRKVAAGEAVRGFDPGMIRPYATIANTEAWRLRNS